MGNERLEEMGKTTLIREWDISIRGEEWLGWHTREVRVGR